MRVIVTSCGTSILTNCAEKELREDLNRYSNAKLESDLPDQLRHEIQVLVEELEGSLPHESLKKVSKASAELNALIRYYHEIFKDQKDHHILICTDTYIGEVTAQIVKQWLQSKNFSVEVFRQKDLQTEQLEPFQLALSEIVIWAENTLPEYQKSGYKIIFNLTGGFKSVNGFLQTLAMFYADEVIYIFERSEYLLRLPRLPIRLEADQSILENLKEFRRLSIGLPAESLQDVPETFLMKIGDEYALSPWGELVWQRHRKQLYQTKLFEPPSRLIRFTSQFRKSIEGLDAKRIGELNAKMDDLTIFLEKNQHLKSLDVKTLRGNPCPPSTHELDAWADQDAKRIFGRYEGNVFTLDKLDKALH